MATLKHFTYIGQRHTDSKFSLSNFISVTNRPRLRTHPPPHSYGNQRLQRQFDGLLMMGILIPETCWAVSVRQSTKILQLIVASSWVFWVSDRRCTEPQNLNHLCDVYGKCEEQRNRTRFVVRNEFVVYSLNLLKPTNHVMCHQFNIQQLHALPLYLCVLYLPESKQRLVPLTA
jgi:hypothetical protein